jgi:uncharacterized membrane protein
MLVFAKWLHLVALIVWVGEIVFFSFVVAPGLFRTFPSVEAGRAVAALFPIYYRIGYACGLALLATCVVFLVAGGARLAWSLAAVVCALMLGATFYAGSVVQPRASVLRPQIHDETAPSEAKEEFSRLHRTAVLLNGAVLVGGIAVSLITAVKLRP